MLTNEIIIPLIRTADGRLQRFLNLSPPSKAEFERRSQARLDADPWLTATPRERARIELREAEAEFTKAWHDYYESWPRTQDRTDCRNSLRAAVKALRWARWKIQDLERAEKYPMKKDNIIPLPRPYSGPSLTEAAPQRETVEKVEDFWALLSEGKYVYLPTGDLWPASSVDARLGRIERKDPSEWLSENQALHQQTWAPGEPRIIRDRLIADGGWHPAPGHAVLNRYRPPVIVTQAGDVAPWLRHWEYIYPEGADHAIKWLAHRVQRPHEKINHALVLGGPQGIGKDTMLEPVKQAVGPWNFADVSPLQVLGRFNGFLKSVILRVSEARDLGDVDRYAFYDHMKAYTAAPPDVLRVDEKNLREYPVPNVTGCIITTNHKTDGIYLPADDRRHYVLWSPRTKDDFSPEYWPAMWRWLQGGGIEAVAHYLMTLDLSGWDPKAPPPKTVAWWAIVDASRAPEDAEMADALDRLGRPAAVTLSHLETRAADDFKFWLRHRQNRRQIPHRMEECGYVPVRNPGATDGHWVVDGRRQAVYARKELSLRDQIAAAQKLSRPF